MRTTVVSTAVWAAMCFLLPLQALAQNLEIHYIDVGWGGSVLVKGPDGTTVLLEGGDTGKGTAKIVPYLQSIGITATQGLDYTVVGHQHCDHMGGLDEVINAGYDVHVANYYNGSSNTSTCVTSWNAAAGGTTAGVPVQMGVGTQILLGAGARITCVARNGAIIGGGSVSVSDENDRSIALLVQYGGFDYLWASDLGGGSIDNACTGRSTSQVDVETSVVTAISPGGAQPMISAGGIDVLHCNHHGSESSTNKNWMNFARPAVGLVSVGGGQTTGWDLPRIDSLEHVLLAQATGCITAPAAQVFQTSEGAPAGALTSHAGYCVGNITVSTDGVSTFTVSGDGAVSQGPNEVVASGLPKTYALDEFAGPPDTTPPVIANVIASNVTGSSAVVSWNTDEPSNSVVEYGTTTAYGSAVSDFASVTAHLVNLAGLANNTLYHYRVRSTDVAGNTATSADHTLQTGILAVYAPAATAILQGSLRSGTVSNLATNNASYYVTNSTTSGTRRSDWYGRVTIAQTPSAVSKLTLTYDGKYSRTVTQTLHLWNWVTAAWTQVDSRSVGSSDVTVTSVQGTPANFVSAAGEVRLRVLGTGATNNFTCSGDYMRFSVETSGQGLTKLAEVASTVPVWHLAQNRPNPFNPSTIIRYDLARDSHVRLVVYDVAGRELKRLVDRKQAAGAHSAVLDGRDMVSGVYFYVLQAGDFTARHKMTLIK